MAISGINPAAFATSELGSMEEAITSITNNSMEPISLPSGTELFTDDQVREILIKFGSDYLPFIDEAGVTGVVDEFMESGEE